MDNLEYGKMSALYDKFYAHKDYKREAKFIAHFLNPHSHILDAGCGTGSHCKELNSLGFKTDGFDLSPDMLSIAIKKVEGNFTIASLLDFSSKIHYDAIISFFAVFNHLRNYKELQSALCNLKEHLKEGGIIILDLHNPQHSGEKVDNIDGATRQMKWKVCHLCNKEYTTITYKVDNETMIDTHTFKIFKMHKIKKIAERLGFANIEFYSNYNTSTPATHKSKNIQVVLYT
ncbi:MAG: class I SAM-dependent methyltransferase [Clostridiales bacterium]|nr:class I SAM-dependent methyltransferase [Clostridiales bacterium]